MTHTSSLPVPDVSPNTSEDRESRGRSLADELWRAADIGSDLAKLPRGQTYRVILSSTAGGGLNPRQDGLYDAFVKGRDGKIVATARLSKVTTGLLTSAGMLAGHAMLAQISAQLQAVQQDVDLLIKMQSSQQLGAINAQIMTLRTIDYYRPEDQRSQLNMAVAELQKALSISCAYVNDLIAAIPRPPEWNITRAIWDTSSATVNAIQRAEDAMRVVLIGLRALGEAELLLNGQEVAAKIMMRWFDQIKRLNLGEAEFLARMIPVTKPEDRYDTFWQRVTVSLDSTQAIIARFLDTDTPFSITAEVRPPEQHRGGSDA